MRSQEKGFTCKLTVHEHSFSTDDVIIYKDYPRLQVGDIIEVYHAEECFSRLLVKVKQPTVVGAHIKDSISIQSSLASAFCLQQFNNVIVNKVNKEDVVFDMLELVFKDQFVTRSDAWRLHQSIIGSCVYFSNKVAFNNMRVHVNEMWMHDDKVACGVVVVYRSNSAKFHIFVQMSVEMWDFDICGDLYFEKAIMGFLQDLFNKWKDKEMDCNHQVVIVLFSRTYYETYTLVFEKTYIDCSLEETNCTTLVITPSTGVFDVDKDLATLTRKQLVDNAVGVDLVCLATQPLHVVPLFKVFTPRSLDGKDYNDATEFLIPQWINLSYYSKEQTSSSVFVHKMQIPQGPVGGITKLERWPSINTDMDHDEFDAQLFNYSKPKHRIPSVRPSFHRNITHDSTSIKLSPEVSKSLSNNTVNKKLSLQDDATQIRFLRSQSEENERLTRHGSMDDLKFNMDSDKDETPTRSSDLLQIQQSDGQIALHAGVINPFKQQSMALALTLFRHRWLHAFPTDMKGISVQEHYQKVINDDHEPTAKV